MAFSAIACVAIADARVAVTVLEVGLGGRLDATNAIDAPVAVVTGVAMDHEAILGGTLAQIAAEKAGIWKRGQRVVIGASGEPAAVPLLDAAARAAGASVITVIDAEAVAAVPPVGLAGAHQRRNAAAALAALDQLAALGVVRVPAEARVRALAEVRHPGRFEIVPGAPQVVLDGAHNPHGARALAALLAERALRPVLVAAVSADKDVAGIAAALAPAVRAVIATRYQPERALPPAALAEAFRRAAGHLPVEEAPDLPAALDAARRLAAPEGAPILVAGPRVGAPRPGCALAAHQRARHSPNDIEPSHWARNAARPSPLH
jgi:dihydrofolate synthase/folylpolyglutamate synthase